MKVLFSGGGTLGPVTPLLAMREYFGAHEHEYVWVGTKKGPESGLATLAGIPYFGMPAGKLRRYFSLWNIVDGFVFVGSFFRALVLLLKLKPDVCITAGGFVSVPVHYAAFVLGIPTWVHQQDVKIGLANRLMGRFARVITTALKNQEDKFRNRRALWLGNPIRPDIFVAKKSHARNFFGIISDLPVLFVTGGGTGSERVNQITLEAVPSLEGVCEIIHLYGQRPSELIERAGKRFSHYRPYKFFSSEMAQAYAASDLVVSRGGFGTITELAALKKPSIFIPKPGHQEQNVKLLTDVGAAISLDQEVTNGNHLVALVKRLLADRHELNRMGGDLFELLPPANSDRLKDILFNIAK